jgi:hypothetical protein
MPGNEFVGPSYNGSFVFPWKNDESKRDVYVAITNLQSSLDLQVIVTCDSSVVKGYVLTSDIKSLDQTGLKFDTNKYNCGEKVRI